MPPQTTPKVDESIASTPKIAPDAVQVENKLYNALKLAKIHPGGEIFVKVFAGKDATEAFLSYHRRGFPHDKYQDACIGDALEFKQPGCDTDYLELCKKVDEVLPRHKTFATNGYWLKLIGLLSITLGLEYYIHSKRQYVWYLTGILGLLYAWVGMNIQHDANHGAISRYGIVNRLLGLTQNWIGGSALDWIHQHVVQHHIYPNDITNDPDIVGNAYLRLNPIKPRAGFHALQYIYVFVLFLFFGLNYTVSTVIHNLQGFHLVKMSELVKRNRIFEESTSAFFFFRWLVFPLIQVPSLNTFLNTLPLFVVGGYYLSFFFIISHNFEGVYVNDPEFTKVQDKSFLRRQVTTAANVGGPWLAFMNGGLNYQIEHHLFPRIQHSHYATIAPVVKAYCESKGIPYVHFPTVWDNVRSCLVHLHQMGTQPNPEHFNTLKK